MVNKNKGFTLIESLIVIAIISILISATLPVFSNYATNNELQNEDTGSIEVMVDGRLQRCDSNGDNCKTVD